MLWETIVPALNKSGRNLPVSRRNVMMRRTGKDRYYGDGQHYAALVVGAAATAAALAAAA